MPPSKQKEKKIKAWACFDGILNKIVVGGMQRSFSIHESKAEAMEQLRGWLYATGKNGKRKAKVISITITYKSNQ